MTNSLTLLPSSLLLLLLLLLSPASVNCTPYEETAWLPHLFYLQEAAAAAGSPPTRRSVLFQLPVDPSARNVTAGAAADRCRLHSGRLLSHHEARLLRRSVSAEAVDALFRLSDTLRFPVTDLRDGYALAVSSDSFKRQIVYPLPAAEVAAGANCVLCLRQLSPSPGTTAPPTAADGLDQASHVLVVLLVVVSSVLALLFVLLLSVNACHLVFRRSALLAAAASGSDLGALAGDGTSGGIAGRASKV